MDVLGPSPDGRLLAGHVERDADHFVEIWDIQEGKRARVWAAHDDRVRCHAFAADGTTLVTGGEDKRIRFWDVATGAKKFELAGHPGIVGILALSADGDTLASVGLTRTEVPNGYSEGPDKQIRVWYVRARKQVRQIDTPVYWLGKSGTELQFAADGKTLVHLGYDQELRCWDVSTGKHVRQLKHDCRGIFTYGLSPAGKTAAVSGNDIQLLNVADGTDAVKADGHRAEVRAAALLGDRRAVVTAAEDGVVLWDATTGRRRRRLVAHDSLVWGLRALPGGRLLGLDVENTLVVWDAANGREQRRLRPAGVTYSTLVPSPDGKSVVVLRKDWSISQIDLETGKELARVQPYKDRGPNGVAFADGRSLVTWHHDRTWRLWDLKTSKLLRKHTFPGDEAEWYTAGLSPDGRVLAFEGHEGFLSLHDPGTGKAGRVIKGLGDRPGQLAVSPDNRVVAWVPFAGDTVRLLELASGQERARLAGHRGQITALEYAADGRTLVTAGQDTTAIVWDVLGGGEAVALGAKELDAAWADLADGDAPRAYQAMRRLAASPDTVAYLRKRLAPVPAVARERLAKLIADLDSDAAADRDRASRELEALDDVAAEACRTALANNPSAELRQRLERLLAPLDARAERPSGNRLRLVRSLEVLERVSSAEATALLKALAGGAPGAFLTREAAEALARGKR